MTSGAELIMVMPGDSLETLSAKVRASRAGALQLLVADNAAAFQHAEAFSRLNRLAVRDGITLTVISSDEQTLAAARAAQLDVVGVSGARVAPQVAAPPPLEATRPMPYETRYIPRGELEQPLSAEDADFLQSLDRVPDERYLDGRLDDGIDDEIDDFDDSAEPTAPRGTNRSFYDDEPDDYAPPRRRFDDDDIEDVTPPRNRRGTALAKAALAPTYRSRGQRYEDDEALPQRQGGGILLPVVFGALLALALVGVWLWSNRPVVYIWPAASAVKTSVFAGEIIPVADNAAGEDAVKAAPLATTAEVTVQGRASKQLSPAGTARGTVQIINSLNSPIDLPAGTQFVAKNAAGQDVSFLIDSPATVPPSVTSTSILGSSTSFGTIEVAVSARSPGSASNVDANAVTRLTLPDGQNLAAGGGIVFQNQPIQGGSEEEIYIVAEPDVRAALGDGLTQLYGQGVAALQTQQVPSGFVLDQATVFPDPQALGDPVNYEPPAISPAIGQPVADQANPVFTMTLRASFSALAAPPASGPTEAAPVAAQLQTFVPNYLYQQRNGNLCAANEKLGIDITRYVWNGQQLAVDGAVTCTPPNALADATLAQIKDSLVGQPAESAEATLAQLRQNGAIGGYQLPQNVETFPGLGFMVRVERAPDNTEPPQGPPPVPTAAPASETTMPEATVPAATSDAAPTAGATP